MADRIALTFTGFKKLERKLEPRKFERRLKKNVEVGTRKVGLLAQRKIGRDIRQKKVKPSRLSGLTVAMKGSTTALVDTGQLLKSITNKVVAWHTVIVGVLKNRPVRDQLTGKMQDVIMIAKILHDGADVPVSEKMRRFFFWLANGSNSPFKGKVKPLKASTRMIHVPARPFMRGVLEPQMIREYKQVWEQAVSKTLRGE